MHDELTSLRKDFAGFRIWRETFGERVLYVARSQRAGAQNVIACLLGVCVRGSG